ITRHASDSVPPDGVKGTRPPEGVSVPRGSRIDLELSSGPSGWISLIPSILFYLLAFIFLAVIIYGIHTGPLLGSLAEEKVARGLITFLIAVSTVGIAIILAVSTVVLSETSESDKRFDRGKQVLSVMIGVLGTIVGFYFGAAQN